MPDQVAAGEDVAELVASRVDALGTEDQDVGFLAGIGIGEPQPGGGTPP